MPSSQAQSEAFSIDPRAWVTVTLPVRHRGEFRFLAVCPAAGNPYGGAGPGRGRTGGPVGRAATRAGRSHPRHGLGAAAPVSYRRGC
ncbi:hypothetical protein TNCT1_39690 [Streptomyces sp. 1-11]|nr:hypothetical protein TNCT1_39690 [Streptomyces sp. 1-11]